MTAFILKIILQAFIAFITGTVLLDILHYLFHRCLKSKYKILKAIGRLHTVHHHFYTSALKIDDKWIKRNLLQHVLLEYVVHMSGILFCLLFLNPWAVMLAAIFETSMFIGICYCRGIDFHHLPQVRLPSSRGGLFVSTTYHAYHHLHPDHYFGSYIKLIDYVFGTGHSLKGKRIAMTGASGALGSWMKKLLEKEGAIVTAFKFGVDYTYDNYEKLKQPLENTDILFLCHGSKYENAQQANCDSFVAIIELFKSVRKPELVPVEVWGVGSEIEFHPCFGIKKLIPYAKSKRNYARYARVYFHDRNIQYRHLIHSAFTSRMGPGLMTANFAARMTLFFIKRDFKYVPVSYMGFGWLNYFRYIR